MELPPLSKTIVEHNGRRFNRTELPSGAIIKVEIIEPTEPAVPRISDRALINRLYENSEEMLTILRGIKEALGAV